MGQHDQKLMSENLTEMLTPIAFVSPQPHLMVGRVGPLARQESTFRSTLCQQTFAQAGAIRKLTEMLTPIAHMAQHTHQVGPWGHECATGQRFRQLYLEQLLVTRTNRKLTEMLTLPHLWLRTPT